MNPAHSEVFGNIVIDEGRNVGRFDPSVRQFSTIHSNFAYATLEERGSTSNTASSQTRRRAKTYPILPIFLCAKLAGISRALTAR